MAHKPLGPGDLVQFRHTKNGRTWAEEYDVGDLPGLIVEENVYVGEPFWTVFWPEIGRRGVLRANLLRRYKP